MLCRAKQLGQAAAVRMTPVHACMKPDAAGSVSWAAADETLCGP